MHEFNITLFRDSLSTPWGIRLEGGRDFGTPLTIQRVFAGTPASGDLQRGDAIVLVQNRNASNLSHQEANDIIKNSGGSISFTIRRGGQSYPSVVQMSRPHQHAVNFGPPKHAMTKSVNYAPFAPSHLYEAEDPLQSYVRSRPIEKVKNPKPILSQTGSPIMPGDTPSMQIRTQVRRFRPASTLPMLGSPKQGGAYSSNNPYYDAPSYSPTSPNQQFTYVQPTSQVTTYAPMGTPAAGSQQLVYPYNNAHLNSTPVPFSERKMATQLQHSLTRAAANKFNAPAPVYHQQQSAFPFAPSSIQHKPQQYHQQQHHHQPEPYTPPPWKDSLKSNFETPHSPSFHVGGGAGGSPATPKTPKVVNLQYNTPIGLYSKENIQQELHRQVGNANLPFVPASEF